MTETDELSFTPVEKAFLLAVIKHSDHVPIAVELAECGFHLTDIHEVMKIEEQVVFKIEQLSLIG